MNLKHAGKESNEALMVVQWLTLGVFTGQPRFMQPKQKKARQSDATDLEI